MKKLVFITLYDVICIGPRLLSSIAKTRGVRPYLVILKDQRTRPILRDSSHHLVYQFYIDGIKHGSCYAAYPYTHKELRLLSRLVSDIEPDLICLSTRSFGLSAARALVTELRNRGIRTSIVAGGWGPTLEPERFLEFCDYVGFGEGEKLFLGLCDTLAADDEWAHLPNLIFYAHDRVLRRNEVAAPITQAEFDALPFPDYEPGDKFLIDRNRIMSGAEFQNVKMYNCFAGRGCPLNCTYCMSGRYRDLYSSCGHSIARYRVRSVETVISELKQAKRRGAAFIRMHDEVFPVKRGWVLEFIRLYKEEIGLPFFAYVRPEFHDARLLGELRAAGLCSTVVGIQAGAEHIRKDVFRRQLRTDVLQEFAVTLRSLRIQYTYHLIGWNPFESVADMDETLSVLRELPYSSLVLFKLVAHPGTPIAEMIQRGRVTGVADKVYRWYGYLYMLSVKSAPCRKIAKVLQRLGPLRASTIVCAALMLPSFMVLAMKKRARKWLFGASTLGPIPLRKPKCAQNAPRQRTALTPRAIDGVVGRTPPVRDAQKTIDR